MKRSVFTRRLGTLCFAVAVGCLAASFAGTAQADLLVYDPFLTTGGNDANPAVGQYFKGNDDGPVNPIGGQNPIVGPTAFYSGGWIQSGGDAQSVKAGSLSYPNFPNLKGRMAEQNQFDCCTFGRNG